MSDDMAAEQREPKYGLKWAAELHRLDGDGNTYTVTRIVGEHAWSVTQALRDSARWFRPSVQVTTMNPDDERRLLAALDEANTPPVVSPEGGRPGETAPATGLSATESAGEGAAVGREDPEGSRGLSEAVFEPTGAVTGLDSRPVSVTLGWRTPDAAPAEVASRHWHTCAEKAGALINGPGDVARCGCGAR